MTTTQTGGRRAVRWVLIAIIVAGLLVDVYVHFHLAARYDPVKGTGSPPISQGLLFRVEAVSAALAIAAVLLLRRRAGALAALAVAGGGVAVVLLYRYVDVGAIGPVPDMYEPIWYAEKTFSAVAEGIAAVAALACLLTAPRRAPRGGTER